MNNKHIDPNDVRHKLDNNLFYKESFVLFSVLVAGKSSTVMMNKTNNLIDDIIGDVVPDSLFTYIVDNYSKNDFEPLMDLLKKNKTGKYTLLFKFFNDIKNTNINVSTCSIKELESIKGIGKKSSRFFMLYNRVDIQNVGVLDTHILKFLGKNGIDVPKQTPSGKLYDNLEIEFLKLAAKIRPKMSISELDFHLWYNAKEYNKIPTIKQISEEFHKTNTDTI